MNKSAKTLALSAAISEGYEFCVEAGGDRFQRITSLLDLLQEWPKDKSYVLVEKEPYTIGISPEEIAELVADHAYVNVGDETGDDDLDDLYNEVKALDYSVIAACVNDVMLKKKYYRGTNILVVPDEKNPNG